MRWEWNILIPGLWPEEHSETRVWRAECADGHEHHLQGEEGDPLDRIAYQLCSGMHQPGAWATKTRWAHQTKNAAATRAYIAGKILFSPTFLPLPFPTPQPFLHPLLIICSLGVFLSLQIFVFVGSFKPLHVKKDLWFWFLVFVSSKLPSRTLCREIVSVRRPTVHQHPTQPFSSLTSSSTPARKPSSTAVYLMTSQWCSIIVCP